MEYDYAYKCQSHGNWQQIGIVLKDGSQVFIDLVDGKFSDHYRMTADGQCEYPNR